MAASPVGRRSGGAQARLLDAHHARERQDEDVDQLQNRHSALELRSLLPSSSTNAQTTPATVSARQNDEHPQHRPLHETPDYGRRPWR